MLVLRRKMKKKPKFKWFGKYKIFADGAIEGPGADRKTRAMLRPAIWGLYYMVKVHVSGKLKTTYIHHLVAESFLGKRPKGHHVNHKDGNKLNNHYKNLEYVTPRQNCVHAGETRLLALGSKHGQSKLTEDAVRFIRKNRNKHSLREFAKMFGVTGHAVNCAYHRVTWRHVR